MSSGKLAKWIDRNLVVLVVIPLLIGIHWGWYKIQQNPNLVHPSERKDVPLIAAAKKYKEYFWGTSEDTNVNEQVIPGSEKLE